jgi:hypothetical protein
VHGGARQPLQQKVTINFGNKFHRSDTFPEITERRVPSTRTNALIDSSFSKVTLYEHFHDGRNF